MKYIIAWRSKITGESGHGTVPLEEEAAEAWIEKLNREHPYLVHWLTPVMELSVLPDTQENGRE